MNLSFKIPMHKEWTLLDDRVMYGDKEILLSEITAVKLVSKGGFGMNGVIQIMVGRKWITLGFPPKMKEEGNQAFLYIQDNYGSKEEQGDRKTDSEIRKEIDALPCKDEFGTRKEISELPNLLRKDEIIKAITSGLTDGNTWLIVCTTKRVLMIDKGMIYGVKTIDIPLDRINSISHSKGLLLGKISITDGATTRTIENVSNSTVSFFADVVNKEIEMYKQSKNTPVTQIVNTTSSADELIKYKQLLDMGVLTQEEFDTKKKELLGF